jgi:hypothetical protein
VAEAFVTVGGGEFEQDGRFWNPPFTHTAADGSFDLRGVPDGSFVLLVKHPDLAQSVGPEVAFRAGASSHAIVALRAGGCVHGKLTRAGKPEVGAKLELLRRGDPRRTAVEARMLSDGTFEAKALAPGEYTVAVESASTEKKQELKPPVIVLEGRTTTVDVALPDPGE